MDDSPGLEVMALLGGGALRAGLGCEGSGGVGLTRVLYLLSAGATYEEPTPAAVAALPWMAVAAGVVATAAAEARATAGTVAEVVLGPSAAGAGATGGAAIEAMLGPPTTGVPGLELTARGREVRRTCGRKE